MNRKATVSAATSFRNGRPTSASGADDELPLCVFGPGGDFRTAWLPGPRSARTGRRVIEQVALSALPVVAGGTSKSVRAWWSRLAALLKAAREEMRRAMCLRAMSQLCALPPVVLGPAGLDPLVEH